MRREEANENALLDHRHRIQNKQKTAIIVDDIVLYCVANMPGAVPRTSTFALTNATLPFILDLVKDTFSMSNGVSFKKAM